MDPWKAYARFLIGSFMHAKRNNTRRFVKNIDNNNIQNANPNKIPMFNDEQLVKAQEYTALMTNTELWTKYKGGEPDRVCRALWLPHNMTFQLYNKDAIDTNMFLYEAMPFSTSKTIEDAKDYLNKSAFKLPGYKPYIFVIHLTQNNDAYIDALTSYDTHIKQFHNAGFKARNQLVEQNEITLYPGKFAVKLIINLKNGTTVIHVKRYGSPWIIENGGLTGGSRRTRRNRNMRRTRRKTSRT